MPVGMATFSLSISAYIGVGTRGEPPVSCLSGCLPCSFLFFKDRVSHGPEAYQVDYVDHWEVPKIPVSA